LDTREKILPVESLRALMVEDNWVAVAGLFDPLTAVQATRLAEVAQSTGRKILAIVLESENTLLRADARACLMAGLREVRAVVVAKTDEWRLAIPPDSKTNVVEDMGAEKARTAEFVQFVFTRQSTESR
jgi:hypothetical protein